MQRSTLFPIRAALVSLIVLALSAVALPQRAQAAVFTSGGATIYNTAKVTYQAGTTSLFASANVSVTVTTIPAAPTVTNPSNQTVLAGAAVTYNYLIKSNSNGTDTYTTSALTNTATGISAATGTSVTASVSLWGGVALGSGAGTITVPYGTTTGLVAGTSTVEIGANQYTVSTISAGSAASTDASGNLVAEVPATLTLTPIGAAPAITAGSVVAGTQVGEYKSTAITAALTAGTPTVSGTDGSYATHFTISTASTPVVTFTTTDVTTTVSSPQVTITKESRNATTNTAFVTSGTTAKPGEVIEYRITVKNTHPTAQVTNVTVIDDVPAYTAYVANSTTLNGITVAGDGTSSPLRSAAGGLLVDNNGSRTAGTAATGTLAANSSAVVIYQVKVQ